MVNSFIPCAITRVRIGEGAIVTMGATTFILHVPGGEEEEDF